MKCYKTEQERFWNGNFGDEYIVRNQGDNIFSSKINMFSKILSNTKNVKSCLELGANIGLNLKAIQLLDPSKLIQMQ